MYFVVGSAAALHGRGGGGGVIYYVFPKFTFPPWLHPVKIWLHAVSG